MPFRSKIQTLKSLSHRWWSQGGVPSCRCWRADSRKGNGHVGRACTWVRVCAEGDRKMRQRGLQGDSVSERPHLLLLALKVEGAMSQREPNWRGLLVLEMLPPLNLTLPWPCLLAKTEGGRKMDLGCFPNPMWVHLIVETDLTSGPICNDFWDDVWVALPSLSSEKEGKMEGKRV